MSLPKIRLARAVFALSFVLFACGSEEVAPNDSDAGGDGAAVLVACQIDQDCDDGTYCNGEEICDPQNPDAHPVTHCVDSQAPIVCDDDIACTSDRCDEANTQCVFEAPDKDGDGHADATCVGDDEAPLGDDCDDLDDTRFPGNTEVCEPGTANATHDEDCIGTTFGNRDIDRDRHEDARCCNPNDAGILACGDDCDDSQMTVYPGAGELCDGLDNDCDPDRSADESPINAAWYPDVDGDQYGDPLGESIASCSPLAGRSSVATDCDDGRSAVNPGNPEVCDGLDNDCSGNADDQLFCGACQCSLANVTSVACTAGPMVCTVDSCDVGFLDCDDNDLNGCEALRSEAATCGRCGRTCDVNATCIPSNGTFDCECESGYSGDGVTCAEIDECEIDNGGCDPLATCSNVPGSRTCSCPTGFDTSDAGLTCVPVLTGITVTGGMLSPAFDATRLTYTVGASLSTTSVALTPTAVTGVSIAINGVALAPGAQWSSPTLAYGSRTVTVTVSAPAHSDRSYRLTIQRGYVEAYVKPTADGNAVAFGNDVALSADGSTLAVAAPGEYAIDIFTRSSNMWAHQARLEVGGISNQVAGAIALSNDGNTLVVGMDYGSFTGNAVVFVRSNGAWTDQHLFTGPSDAAYFGSAAAVSGDGNTVVIGAYYEDVPGGISYESAGAVYVSTRTGTTWSHLQRVVSTNLYGMDYFGWSVALSTDGNTLAVGAQGQENSGAAYVFARAGGVWTQQAFLKSAYPDYEDFFGQSVSLSGDGNMLAVGVPCEDGSATGLGGNAADDGAIEAGAAYTFTRSGTTWSADAYVKASNTGVNDLFGWTVSLSRDGTRLLVGAPGESSNATNINGNQSNNSATNSGAAYLFARQANTWNQTIYIKASNAGANDNFGWSVAISADGSRFAIGANNESSNAVGINGNQNNNSAEGRGAVYVFR